MRPALRRGPRRPAQPVGAQSHGAYLKAKAKADHRDRKRLEFHFSPFRLSRCGHRAPPGMRFLMGALGMHRFRPILIEELASSLLHVAQTGTAKGQILGD